jgi:hypothetical protein
MMFRPGAAAILGKYYPDIDGTVREAPWGYSKHQSLPEEEFDLDSSKGQFQP